MGILKSGIVAGGRKDYSAGLTSFDILSGGFVEAIKDAIKIEAWRVESSDNGCFNLEEYSASIPFNGVSNMSYKDLETVLSASIGIMTKDLVEELEPVSSRQGASLL